MTKVNAMIKLIPLKKITKKIHPDMEVNNLQLSEKVYKIKHKLITDPITVARDVRVQTEEYIIISGYLQYLAHLK